jgi:hypothetical protein
MDNNQNTIYYTYGMDLFGYYYLETTLKNQNRIQRKYFIYKDTLDLILSLDKELYKKYKKNYKIILNSSFCFSPVVF